MFESLVIECDTFNKRSAFAALADKQDAVYR